MEFSSNAAQVDEFGYTGLKKNNPLNDELITKIEGIPEISDVMEIKDLEVAYTYNGERDEQDLAAPFTKEEAELMQSYVKTGQLDYEKMVKNKEVFIAHNEIVKEIFGWEFKVGLMAQSTPGFHIVFPSGSASVSAFVKHWFLLLPSL